METIKMLLSRLAILIGVFSVFTGMMAATDNSASSISIVIGGGLFMALGITFVILERN